MSTSRTPGILSSPGGPVSPAWLPAPDDEAVADALAAAFTARLGAPPEGIWAAPGRVNLIGEHTDYNQGLCLPLALPHRTYAAARRRTDATITLASVQQPDTSWQGTLADIGPGTPTGWAAYPAGVLWALHRRGLDPGGLDVLVDGHVPPGAGLSSSAALECSVALAAVALAAAAGRSPARLNRRALARACMVGENTIAGASTGGMDQNIALRARPGHAMLLDCRDFTTTDIAWHIGTDRWVLLVIDTRTPHTLVDGQYAERRASCERAAARLGVASLRDLDPADLPTALPRLHDDVLVRRTRHVVTEIARVRDAAHALAVGDVTSLGHLMTASHTSLREDYQVSCPQLDTTIETALANGASGARMTGGGFGGSAIALIRHDQAPTLAQAVTTAFTARGWPPPHLLKATPARPAERIR